MEIFVLVRKMTALTLINLIKDRFLAFFRRNEKISKKNHASIRVDPCILVHMHTASMYF